MLSSEALELSDGLSLGRSGGGEPSSLSSEPKSSLELLLRRRPSKGGMLSSEMEPSLDALTEFLLGARRPSMLLSLLSLDEEFDFLLDGLRESLCLAVESFCSFGLGLGVGLCALSSSGLR